LDWRVKCLGFKLIETLPFGRPLYRLLQKRVTGRYLPKVSEASLKSYGLHVDQFKALKNPRVAMEFGAGRGLITALMLGQAGAHRVYAFDLERLASPEQVNAVISQLGRRVPGGMPPIDDLDQLSETYGIEYRAPGDARATGLPEGSVDYIYSSATLEHIPEPEIRQILREAKRVLSPDGRLCFTIDYHDHYASADPGIGYFNFYRFGAREWRRYNPDMHYQNRMRHSDFIRLFEEEGLAILEQRPIFDTWTDRDYERVPLHPEFAHYSVEDLKTSNGFFLLAPRRGEAEDGRVAGEPVAEPSA
jgi:SAM-dependent methyltransferase